MGLASDHRWRGLGGQCLSRLGIACTRGGLRLYLLGRGTGKEAVAGFGAELVEVGQQLSLNVGSVHSGRENGQTRNLGRLEAVKAALKAARYGSRNCMGRHVRVQRTRHVRQQHSRTTARAQPALKSCERGRQKVRIGLTVKKCEHQLVSNSQGGVQQVGRIRWQLATLMYMKSMPSSKA